MNWLEARKKLQAENLPLLRRLERDFNKIKGIRVGDWIKHPNGEMDRVTYIWRDEKNIPMQIQTGGAKHAQYHMDRSQIIQKGSVYVTYSGGLDSGYKVPETKFKKLSYLKNGEVWIWNRGLAGGGRGVTFLMKFRVFEVQ